MKLSFKGFLNYLAVFTVFSGAWTWNISFAEMRIAYLIIAVVLLLWLPFLKGLYFNKIFLLFYFLVVFVSLYNVFIGKNAIGLLAKQGIGILINATFFYWLIKINERDIKRLFKTYLNIAFLVAVIGLLQELSFLLGFKAGYDYNYIIPYWKVTLSSRAGLIKVNSILMEPAHFCIVMMPAFFTSLVSFSRNSFRFLNRWRSSIIILAVILSFSTVGYAGIFLSIFLLIYNLKKLKGVIVLSPFIFLLFLGAYNISVDFKGRIADASEVILGKVALEKANPTTFALYSNALVAGKSFKSNPLFGSGLGSHEVSYFKHIKNVVDFSKTCNTFSNRRDANSLFLRLLSETGLLGIGILFGFICKFYIKKKRDKSQYLWIISNAILVVFFVRLLRMGHYFVGGFFFFIFMYYFAGKTWQSLEAD